MTKSEVNQYGSSKAHGKRWERESAEWKDGKAADYIPLRGFGSYGRRL